MNSQSHIRFNIMLGWCCLLSIAVVIMAIVLSTTISHCPDREKNNRSTEPFSPTFERIQGSSFGQASTNHIHLVSGSDAHITWVKSQSCSCQETSLLLQNSTVTIQVGGFYHIYAQVTFLKKEVTDETVTLVANKNVKGRMVRKLSEAHHHGSGTVSMSGVIHLRRDESVTLEFESKFFSKQGTDTYWGLFLLARQEDNIM
ncbi:lymphotoxin-alpha [Salminus brasiliensis]|uniref:lymphotoxin-alpha n=1 Tax=Salminus brasiliensis TaxID=930266 RepID=UPI003B834843